MSSETRIAYRTCPLCEAGCGLEIAVHRTDGSNEVGRIRGDRDDVFSHGFICPKGSTLRQLHEDPDWLRGPSGQARRPVRAGELGRGVRRGRAPPAADRRAHGRDAVAIYLGNPNAHSLAALLFLRPLIRPSAPPTSSRPARSTSGPRRSPRA